MSLIEFSENELKRLLGNCRDSESLHIQKAINDNILEIVKMFSSQRHSGMTAGYCLNILTRLLDYKPLSAIEDIDEDWEPMGCGEDLIYQHKRCPTVFKDTDGAIFDVEGKVFSDDNGHTWFTCKDSKVFVNMPYTVPDKPEYVIIDNQEERLHIMYHITDRIGYLGAHIVDTNMSEDVALISILDRDKFKELENLLIEDYRIVKPAFSIDEDDTKMWNIINFVMKSEKEEPEKTEEVITEETEEVGDNVEEVDETQVEETMEETENSDKETDE